MKSDVIDKLAQRREAAELGGGQAKIDKRVAKGQMSARMRV